VLLTRSPLGLHRCCHRMDLARLACVRHAASVRPEPGSNSPSKSRPAEADVDLESQLPGQHPLADWHIPHGMFIEIASEQPSCTEERRALAARTGFFVLYSVFKERHVEEVKSPELDTSLRAHACRSNRIPLVGRQAAPSSRAALLGGGAPWSGPPTYRGLLGESSSLRDSIRLHRRKS
jgi:hypothetical protein